MIHLVRGVERKRVNGSIEMVAVARVELGMLDVGA